MQNPELQKFPAAVRTQNPELQKFPAAVRTQNPELQKFPAAVRTQNPIRRGDRTQNWERREPRGEFGEGEA